MPAAAGYVCENAAFPAYKWGSTSDDTGVLPGVTCTPLELPLPGTNKRSTYNWFKIAQLIAEL